MLGGDMLIKKGGKFVRKIVGKVHDRAESSEDLEQIDFIDAVEKKSNEDLNSDERLDVMQWLESSRVSDELRQKLREYIGYRFMEHAESEASDIGALSEDLTKIVLTQISDIFGLHLDTEETTDIKDSARDTIVESIADRVGGGEVGGSLVGVLSDLGEVIKKPMDKKAA